MDSVSTDVVSVAVVVDGAVDKVIRKGVSCFGDEVRFIVDILFPFVTVVDPASDELDDELCVVMGSWVCFSKVIIDSEFSLTGDGIYCRADVMVSKFGSSVCILSWNLRVDVLVKVGSVCDECGMLVGVLVSLTSEALGVAGIVVTNMFLVESTMCVSNVVDVGVSFTTAEGLSVDTAVSTTVEINKAWLD